MIALVVLAMLRPTVIYTRTTKQAATLVVLADQSRSMTVPDAVGDKPRWQALGEALDQAAPAMAKLQRDFELKAYGFDSQLHELQAEDGRIALPEQPKGRQTAIGEALEDVLRQEAGKRLLGVVLLSDGAQRAYRPHDLPPQTAAARLRHLGYPIYTFPLGQSRGLGEARDIAVKDLIASPTVFVKNELVISGQVRVDGYVNASIPVRLLFETAPGKMEVVAQQTVKATADGQLLPIHLSYVPETSGEHKITLEAANQPGELVTTNNRLSTFVHVLKGGLNVLYIEGALRVEEKFIRRALGSSPEIKVDYLRLDRTGPDGPARDLAERFKPGKYDIYILGDVDSTLFRPEDLSALAECISRGAGLMMLGGFQTYGPGGYGETPLARVIPVGMDRLERQQPDEPVRTDLHWPGPLRMRPTRLGRMHFALRLAGDQQPAPRCGRNCLRWKAPTGSTTSRRAQSCWPTPGPTSRSWWPAASAKAACWPSPPIRPGDGGCTATKRPLSDSGGRTSYGWHARTSRKRDASGSAWPSAGLHRRNWSSSPSAPRPPPASRSSMPRTRPKS